MTFIFIILGAVLGAIGVFFYLKPKLKITQSLDKEIIEENEKNRKENQILYTQKIEIKNKCASLTSQKDQLLERIQEIQKQSEFFQKQAEENADNIYKKSFELANEKMSAAADKMAAEFEFARQQAEQEYLDAMACNSETLSKELSATQIAINNAQNQLTDLLSKVAAAVEAAKRQEEMETAQDFYRLNLPDIDIEEILKLREVTVLLRDSEPLNKVIWKVYYEKPYTDLIGRVVGNGVHTGIYKITNLENQKCYVGQAVKYRPMKNFTQLLLGVA